MTNLLKTTLKESWKQNVLGGGGYQNQVAAERISLNKIRFANFYEDSKSRGNRWNHSNGYGRERERERGWRRGAGENNFPSIGSVHSQSYSLKASKGFKLLQLPSVRTLKLYIDANIEDAGDSISRLQHKWKEYEAMLAEIKRKEEHSASGKGYSRSLRVMYMLICHQQGRKSLHHWLKLDEMKVIFYTLIARDLYHILLLPVPVIYVGRNEVALE